MVDVTEDADMGLAVVAVRRVSSGELMSVRVRPAASEAVVAEDVAQLLRAEEQAVFNAAA